MLCMALHVMFLVRPWNNGIHCVLYCTLRHLVMVHLIYSPALSRVALLTLDDDVIKWKHFPRYWPFVRGIHRSPVNSPHKGRWRGALMFSLICARINCWVKIREAGDLKRYRTHYDVIVMCIVQGRLADIGAITSYEWPNASEVTLNSLRPSDAYMRQ